MRFSRIFILAASLLLVTGGVAAGLSGSANAQKADRPLYKDATQPIERRVEDLLSRMSLAEKVAQMINGRSEESLQADEILQSTIHHFDKISSCYLMHQTRIVHACFGFPAAGFFRRFTPFDTAQS